MKINKKIVFLSLVIVIFAVFFLPLIVDGILVASAIPPLFSKIVSAHFNDGEIVIGQGLLYKTYERRIDVSNGYLYGSKFYFRFISEGANTPADDLPELELKFHSSAEDSDTGVISDNGDEIGETEEIIDDLTLNTETVIMLANGEIDPFYFMDYFPGNTASDSDNNTIYTVKLPNDYSVEIKYSGGIIEYMRLNDDYLKQYIDIQTQSVDLFLTERN